MQLTPSSRLGPFEIVAAVGAGGMGEVYRARDTRLDRQVAIKVLSPEIAGSASMRERFEREARAVSQLTHPHICALFDIGHENGTDYLVMEYLEGETLAERLKRGALPLEEVLDYGTQVADALDKAHRHGIIHRDLKPGNIILTREGAKLLDFGLAKLSVAHQQPLGGLTSFPTEHRHLTQEGTILGTFQYMAPEQLEGTEADARTDIFALGVLLYEMTTGRKAFEGKTKTSLIAAIVDRDPPPISRLQPLTPPALEYLIRKCLEKDPERRWQSAADIASQLRWISEGGSEAGVAAPVILRRKHRERAAWTVAGLAAITAAILGALWWRASAQPRPRYEMAINPPPDQRFLFTGRGENMALSPDGTKIVFSARGESGDPRLWIRPLRTSTAQPLNGTEGAHAPFWSPDSRQIGFFANNKLKKIDIAGGPPQTLCDAPGAGGFRGGTWNRENVILFAPSARTPIHRVSGNGGTPVALTKLNHARTEFSHRFPWFLPDGKHFLYLTRRGSNVGEITLGSLDGGIPKPLISVDAPPFYTSPGYILYVRDRILLAQRFNPRTHELSTEAVPLAENIQHYVSAGQSVVTVSAGGVIAYQQGSGATDTELTWFDRTGKVLSTIGQPRDHRLMRLSRDARKVAVTIRDPQSGNDDIWIYELGRGAATRLTFDPLIDDSPVWTAGDREIIYSAENATRAMRDIMIKSSSGEGDPKRLYEAQSLKTPTDVSPDDKWVAFDSIDLVNANGLDALVLSRADGKVTKVAVTGFDEGQSRFSPDGKWIAYVSNESGRPEIYVQRWPPSGGGKWQVSVGGGVAPRWRGDGRQIFYRAVQTYKFMSVDVTAAATFEATQPELMFEQNIRDARHWDASADGQRFLLSRTTKEEAPQPLTVVVNWTEGLPK